MTKEDSTRKNSFIVRVWWTEDQVEWRGWVQHVRSGDSALVQSLDELLAFIELWTGKLTSPGRQAPAEGQVLAGGKGLK